MKCFLCKRALTNPEHARRGYGDDCAKKYRQYLAAIGVPPVEVTHSAPIGATFVSTIPPAPSGFLEVGWRRKDTMPKQKHTPGPWKLMTQPHRFVVISTESKITITEFIPWVDRAEKMADEANGALIAAAPELLSALRRLVSASYSYDNIPSVASALREARAAIAKAEPESSQEAESAKA